MGQCLVSVRLRKTMDLQLCSGLSYTICIAACALMTENRQSRGIKMAVTYFVFMLLIAHHVTGDTCPSQCRCDSTRKKVDCSKRKLTSVPTAIPNDTVALDLSKNSISVIGPEDFAGLRHLRYLNVWRNSISKVLPNTFADMPALEAFNFSSNPYAPSQVALDVVCPLGATEVQDLSLDNLSLVLDETLLSCLTRLKLEVLSLQYNNLGELPDYAFSGLEDLRVLYLKGALRASHFNPVAFGNLTALDKLHLENNSIRIFPRFVFEDEFPILPQLTFLALSTNQISSFAPPHVAGLQKLRRLYLGQNNIAALANNTLETLPNLEVLGLEENPLDVLEPCAFNSSSLTNLDLFNIGLKLKTEHKTLFFHSPNLTNLVLMNTDLFNLFQQHFNIFDKVPKLEKLNMQSSSIRQIHRGVFDKLRHLKALHLTANKISTLPLGVFDGLTSLEKLHMDNNRFALFNRSSFPDHFVSHLKQVSLGLNPFTCTCDLLWFLDWMKHTNITFVGGKSWYLCSAPPKFKGTSLYDVPLTEAVCQVKPLNLALVLSISLSCGVAFILITVSLSYRYRWHIGYLYFSLKARVRHYREIQDDTEYLFDAFLSYNSQDLPWIRQHVLPVLEEETGFHLCLHDRDWLPGPDIMDNIMGSIENSRKTLLVVSNAFATSQWCQVELTMAQHRLFEKDRNNLVLILLEDINPGNMTPRLALQMRSRTYIKWTEDPVGQRLFWRKLIHTLRNPDGPVLQNPNVTDT